MSSRGQNAAAAELRAQAKTGQAVKVILTLTPHHVKVPLTVCMAPALVIRVALKWTLTKSTDMVL